VKIASDGRSAASFSYVDGIIATVKIFFNDRDEMEVVCKIDFIPGLNQKTLQGHASDESST
jgi:hypothetical protein